MQDEVHPRDVVVRGLDSHHVGEVSAQIELRVRQDRRVAPVLHPVDVRRDTGELREQITGVLVHGLPRGHPIEAFLVELRELRLALHRQDRAGEHGHRMAVPRHRPENVDHVLRHRAPRLEVRHDLPRLLIRRNFAREQEVPEALDVRVVLALRLRQLRHHLGDGLAAKADPLHGVQVRDVGDEAAHASRPADGLRDGDLPDLDVAVLPDQLLGPRAVSLDLLSQDVL
jgi:hypothetical protein